MAVFAERRPGPNWSSARADITRHSDTWSNTATTLRDVLTGVSAGFRLDDGVVDRVCWRW